MRIGLKILSLISASKQLFISWWRVKVAAKYITPVSIAKIQQKKKTDVTLILVIKDEADRIPYFLKYYRGMGVNHFIIIDNQSSDDLSDLICNQPDVSHFKVTQAYQNARYGVDWINYVARKYCINSWVLSVDSDELLVYPNQEHRTISELCRYLDDNDIDKFYTPMIDMYGDKPVMNTAYKRGDNPLVECCYFDKCGYFEVKGGWGNPWLRGGVRMRVFSKNSPLDSPALNKFALVKWDWLTLYYKGAHTMLPKTKNTINANSETLSGALLHFKFFDDLYRKSVYAVKHGNHYAGSAEYELYLDIIEEMQETLAYEHSERYLSFQSLIDNGLANNSSW